MALKDILVCLDPTDASDIRLRFAAALAREHHAHLSGAFLLSDAAAAAPAYGAPYGNPSSDIGIAAPAGTAAVAEGNLVAGVPMPAAPGANPEAARGAELADIVERRFRETVRPHAVEGDWHLFGRGDTADLVDLVNAVDLVVAGQVSRDYPIASGFRPAEIVVAAGRPLLVLPHAGQFAGLGRRVLVAWDGTREASRAVHDALPLLGKAERVFVLTVRAREADFERDRPSLDRVTRHLVRHGIPAMPETELRGDLGIADVLLSRAADLDIDLIVAGAYHHSPLREALLGGVSRELLDHSTVPLLMSH